MIRNPKSASCSGPLFAAVKVPDGQYTELAHPHIHQDYPATPVLVLFSSRYRPLLVVLSFRIQIDSRASEGFSEKKEANEKAAQGARKRKIEGKKEAKKERNLRQPPIESDS